MFSFKPRCYNGGNKHKFEPRYDEKPRDIGGNINARGFDPEDIRSLYIYKEYHSDVCTWCGKRIKKEDSGV